jgi:hypothetical protein
MKKPRQSTGGAGGRLGRLQLAAWCRVPFCIALQIIAKASRNRDNPFDKMEVNNTHEVPFAPSIENRHGRHVAQLPSNSRTNPIATAASDVSRFHSARDCLAYPAAKFCVGLQYAPIFYWLAQ